MCHDTVRTVTVTDELGFKAKDVYDGLGRLTEQYELKENGTDFLKVQGVEYDELGRIYKISDALDVTTAYLYDYKGRVTQVCVNEYNYKTFNIYNDALNTVENFDVYAKSTKSSFDKFGRLVKTEYDNAFNEETNCYEYAYSHEYTYNYADNLLTEKDANGNITKYDYDGLLRLQTVENPLQETVEYEYNNLNQITKTVYPNKNCVIETNYDEIGRVVKATDALGQSAYMYYDDAGNLERSVDRNGNEFSYVYNNRNMPVSTLGPNSSVHYTYDDGGRVKLISNETGITTYDYYRNGLLKKETKPDGKYIQYEYNDNKSKSKTVDYFGNETTYNYDTQNRLQEIRSGNDVISYQYYHNDLIRYVRYPNGIEARYDYDDTNRLKTLTNKKSETVISKYEYTYDGINQRTKTETDAQGTRLYEYDYDELSRIKTVTEPEGVTAYSYDENSNISTVIKTGDGAYTQNYSYDLNNRLIKSNKSINNIDEIMNYQYDNNGNTYSTQKSIVKSGSDNAAAGLGIMGKLSDDELKETAFYSYNDFGQMTQYSDLSGTTASYAYDVNGLRLSKTVNGETTKFYYDGGYIINEAVNDTEKAVNIHAPGYKQRRENGQTTYYTLNGHGDVAQLTNSGGNVIKSYDYDVFGREKNVDEDDTNPFRYCGEYTDLSSGLIYLRNRYYDPLTSRFISEDPIRDGTNWYIYCNNNPILYIDPWGLESYVFYTSTSGNDFSSQAQWQKERLEGMGEIVIMIECNDVDAFTNGWNGMGTVDGKTVDINTVVIYTHGNERAIMFENGSSTNAMTINGKNRDGTQDTGNINDLDAKEMKELHLLSCNGGNVLTYYNKGENLASVFSKKVVNGNLYAYDGNVSFGKPVWDIFGEDIGKSSRLATNQHGFNEIAKSYGATGRKPLGKVTYYNGEYKPYGYWPNTSISAN